MKLADDVVIITEHAVAILALLAEAKQANSRIEQLEDEIRAAEQERDLWVNKKRALENEARKIHNARWE